MAAVASTSVKRGTFIVLEGLDKAGKSSQVKRLVEGLEQRGVNSKACRFPDRTTSIGKMIDAYLSNKADIDDRAVHLLFSSNRWERSKGILADLAAGTSIVCDRYAFSGIAFTAAKGYAYQWCKAPDVGLPEPDLVIFLDVPPEVAEQRGGYGTERYESREMQAKVRDLFQQIGDEFEPSRWSVVDASPSMDDVATQLLDLAMPHTEKEKGEVGRIWENDR